MPNQVPSIQVGDLPDGAALLDVRENDEWAAGRAPTAQHVPMGELLARLGELPAGGTVYVICRSGVRSARVAAYLNANGWDAVNVEGGMQSWQASGRDLVADSAEPRVL
jgi:rhodanese-related sulfurtransferase